MTRTATEDARYAAYRRGFEDAQRGVFAPPTGNGLLDLIFPPIIKLRGSPKLRLPAEEWAAAYSEGHAAYGTQWSG